MKGRHLFLHLKIVHDDACERVTIENRPSATGVGQYPANFHVEEDVLHQSFLHGWLGQWRPYNVVADSFHTKELCSRLSSSEVRFYREYGRFAFLSPLWGSLGATYDVLWLLGKHIVDFLLVLIRPPDISREGLEFYPLTLFIYFLSIHRAQQPRSGRPSNLFRRFGRR